MIFALLPLKPFAVAKSRLASVLTSSERKALAQAMAADVLEVLNAVPAIDEILIVSDEPDVARWAAGARATCLRDATLAAALGLNAVVTGAAAYLAARGSEAMLVIPGDLPQLAAEEVGRFIGGWRTLQGCGRVALSPAQDGGGTNLLLASPPNAIPFSYGEGSFAAHKQAALQLGCTLTIVELEGAAADVDNPSDLEALSKAKRLGHHTAALLRSGALGEAPWQLRLTGPP